MIHICFDFFSHSKISPSERRSAAANFPVSVANSIPYYIIYSMLKLLKIAVFTKFSYLFYTVFHNRNASVFINEPAWENASFPE